MQTQLEHTTSTEKGPRGPESKPTTSLLYFGAANHRSIFMFESEHRFNLGLLKSCLIFKGQIFAEINYFSLRYFFYHCILGHSLEDPQ